MKKIYILGTGGTIAGSSANSEDVTGYAAGAISISQVADAVPAISKLANLEFLDVCQMDSKDATLEIWKILAKTAQEILELADCDGIVIAHGTDTLEEVSYFLNLVLKTTKPVVLTAAMRPATAQGADGPMNIYNAVAVAASDKSAGKGVMVVVNDTIIAARYAQKVESQRPNAFSGGEFGTLGYAIGGDVEFFAAPSCKHTFDTEFSLLDVANLPAVEVVYPSVGSNPKILELLADLGVKGIIIAGYGSGSVPNDFAVVAEELVDKGVIVATVRRTAFGGTVTFNDKFINCSNLKPQKARVLLMLALAKGLDFTGVQKCFEIY